MKQLFSRCFLFSAIALSTSLLALGMAFAAPTSYQWTVISTPTFKVTRAGDGLETWTTLIIRGSPFAVIHRERDQEGDGANISIQLASGESILYPAHLDLGTKLPYAVFSKNGIRKNVSFGTALRISSSVEITNYGVTKLPNALIFPSGFILLRNGQSSYALYPRSSEASHSIQSVDPAVQLNLRNLRQFLTSQYPSANWGPVTKTNYEDAKLLTESSLSAAAASGSNCQELPPCCCGGKTPCKKSYIMVPGAFGDSMDGAIGVIREKMKSLPCGKNVFGFDFEPAAPVKPTAKKLAELANEVAAACGNTTTLVGFCYGGIIAHNAVPNLDINSNFTIDFWDTPFDGASFTSVLLANITTLGISNLFFNRPQLGVLYNANEQGPSYMPENVWANINIGGSDGYLSEESQRGNIRNPESVNIFRNGTHGGNAQDNFSYPTCCGDGSVDEKEICDPPGSDCDWMPPNRGTKLPGTCDKECQCFLGFCGDGIVQDKLNEKCDPPGKICDTVSVPQPDGSVKVVNSLCDDKCACPPIVVPGPCEGKGPPSAPHYCNNPGGQCTSVPSGSGTCNQNCRCEDDCGGETCTGGSQNDFDLAQGAN